MWCLRLQKCTLKPGKYQQNNIFFIFKKNYLFVVAEGVVTLEDSLDDPILFSSDIFYALENFDLIVIASIIISFMLFLSLS